MARPIARSPQGVLHTYDPDTQKWRPITPEESGELRPRGVLDEQGVTHIERWTIKNLAANPAAAEAFLRLKGYQVARYGDGMNMAVRRGDGEPWKLVDPAKGGLTEVFKDLVDLLGDVGVGAATGAGTLAGGGLASIATGAASGAAAETGRELLGRAAGIPQGIDPLMVAGSAVGGAIAPPIGKLVGKVARGVAGGIARATRPGGIVSRAGEAFTQRVAGIEGGTGIEISDVMLERAATMPHPVFTPDDGVSLIRTHIDQIAGKKIEFDTKLLEKFIPKGSTVNLVPLKKQLMSLSDTLKPSRLLTGLAPDDRARLQATMATLLQRPSRSAIAAQLQQAAAQQTFGSLTPANFVSKPQINAAFKSAMRAWNGKLRSADARMVFRIKRVLQQEIAAAKGFMTTGAVTPGAVQVAKKEEIRLMSRFSHQLTNRFHNAMPKRLVLVDKNLSGDIRARNGLRDLFGERALGKPDAAVTNLRNAFSPAKANVRRALKAYDSRFPGLGFERFTRDLAVKTPVPRLLPQESPGASTGTFDLARQIFMGGQFTPKVGQAEEFGLPSPIGRFTATGGIFGASLIGGGLGAAAGGPMGALAGAAAAPFVFSPTALVRAAPFASRTNAFVSRMATGVDKVLATKMLREATAVLGTSAAQATGRRIASEDAKGRRRTVFIGR